MRKPGQIIVTAALLALPGCKSNNDLLPAEETGGPFSVSITVTDTLSRPVRGLQISVLTGLAGVQRPLRSALPPSQIFTASTTLGFECAQTARVSLTVLDLDNRPVSTIVDQALLGAGSYSFTWSTPRDLPTRVFKCRFMARDTANNSLLFADSNYAVLWQRDPMLAAIGTTSAAGTFTTPDSLLFPNVLALPPLVLTGSLDPTPLGEFSVRDTVTFVLTDTVSRRSQFFHAVTGNGPNILALLWNPSSPLSPANHGGIVPPESSSPGGPGGGLTWKLRQNYPNPFN